MFSTLYGTYFPFQMHFKMSAICFNLDQCKILSSGNGLNGENAGNNMVSDHVEMDVNFSKIVSNYVMPATQNSTADFPVSKNRLIILSFAPYFIFSCQNLYSKMLPWPLGKKRLQFVNLKWQ